MDIKRLRASLLGALVLVPNLVWSDAGISKIFLLANQTDGSTEATTLEVYSTLDQKLSEFMRAQQLEVISSYNSTKTVTSFSNPGVASYPQC